MIVYLQLSTHGMLSYVILCKIIFVYRMFLKPLVELSMIQLLTSNNIEFSIQFFLFKIFLRKSKLLPSLIAVLFAIICPTLYTMFFQHARIYNLYGMHFADFKYEKCYKNVSFDVCNVYFGVYPLNGENRTLNFVILYIKQLIFLCKKQKKTHVVKVLILFKSKIQV